jgi:simple sugar transport system permease protein
VLAASFAYAALVILDELGAATLRVSTPLVFAALGGLYSERAGVVNIALEGMMLMGAFGAATGTLWSQNPWVGAVSGMAFGLGLAALYGLFVIPLRANQVVAGTAINILAMGLTPVLCKSFYEVTSSTPSIPLADRFQSAPVLAAWVLVFATWLVVQRTPPGLWLRFAGENPDALDSAGVRVNRVRWAAVLVSGLLAGLGGASLSIFLSSSFSRNMTAGRGFIALAALIFGKWRPLPAALACLLFGFFEAAQIRLQGVTFPGGWSLPVQFVQILPYVLTLLILAGFVGQARPPKALGIPFRRD